MEFEHQKTLRRVTWLVGVQAVVMVVLMILGLFQLAQNGQEIVAGNQRLIAELQDSVDLLIVENKKLHGKILNQAQENQEILEKEDERPQAAPFLNRFARQSGEPVPRDDDSGDGDGRDDDRDNPCVRRCNPRPTPSPSFQICVEAVHFCLTGE